MWEISSEVKFIELTMLPSGRMISVNVAAIAYFSEQTKTSTWIRLHESHDEDSPFVVNETYDQIKAAIKGE